MNELTQEQLIQKCIDDYKGQLPLYQKMDNYYKGNTDAMLGYQIITSRANNKVPNNFIKKFIKEEVSYAVGNKITYISRSSNEEIIKQITDNTAHFSELHDQNVMKNMLKFGFCYELYYLDKEGRFSARVLTPLNAYGLFDENNNPVIFMHFFYKKFDDKSYMDLYFADKIVHYADNVVIGETKNNINWGGIPVSRCTLSEEMEQDTLYKDLKGLVDAYEVNLSDISNEISDFRNAYLVLLGCDMEPEDLIDAKIQGAFKLPNGESDMKWLIKNINDSFVQNTLTTIKENIYELSSHINSNEKLQSNTSSLALRTRLISLEQRVKLNCNAMADFIKSRLKFLFKYVSIKTGKQFDYTDIKVKFTPMIPQDDLMTAQILSQAGDKISTRTGIAQFSFIDNVDEEMKRIDAEREMIDLDRIEETDE